MWDALRQVGYGQTMSYRQVAERLGNPKAVRPVGSANSRNPIFDEAKARTDKSR